MSLLSPRWSVETDTVRAFTPAANLRDDRCWYPLPSSPVTLPYERGSWPKDGRADTHTSTQAHTHTHTHTLSLSTFALDSFHLPVFPSAVKTQGSNPGKRCTAHLLIDMRSSTSCCAVARFRAVCSLQNTNRNSVTLIAFRETIKNSPGYKVTHNIITQVTTAQVTCI